VSSQFDGHKKLGGVVPDLAARAHVEKIDLIVKEALMKSKKSLNDIDAVAATAGPGLIVCLSVGLNFAKALSLSLNKPLIGVNHLEGHALSPKLQTKLDYPYLLLLISGGHSQFLCVNGLGDYKRLGTTIDDALGEAFDKTAKLLGIEFPGGPKIEILAKKGNPNKFKLPMPIINKGGCNFSFAGLKTAVLKISRTIKTEQEKYDLAASFQNTIERIIYKKTQVAFNEYLKINNNYSKNFVVAGGVAANKNIRKKIEEISNENNFNVFFPSLDLCGDNAAMIAMVGLEKFKSKNFDRHDWKQDQDGS
jgi:putative glycoprotease GCP